MMRRPTRFNPSWQSSTQLPQRPARGEFSVLATGLNSDSAGDSTKLFSMQQGSADMTTNPYRATIEKRDHGTVTFRFIAGDVNARADSAREDYMFNPAPVLLEVHLEERLCSARRPRRWREWPRCVQPGRQLQRHVSPNAPHRPSRSPSGPGWHQHGFSARRGNQ
jgi:hypothetical protein